VEVKVESKTKIDFDRPSWDDYFLEITRLTSKRSNCARRRVGSIIVKDTRILSLGYNGTPKGLLNCYEGGCIRCNKVDDAGNALDLCVCLHAEENAILFIGTQKTNGATLYTTMIPCIGCSKKIIQAGIKRVVYINSYREELDTITIKLMSDTGIILEKVL
jgi:dCMP deaminase